MPTATGGHRSRMTEQNDPTDLAATTGGETYGDYSVDDEDQPGAEDFMYNDPVDDPLDAGYSPPEKYSAGQGFGNTPWEEERGETLEQRVQQEIPEKDPYTEDTWTEDQEQLDAGQVGDARAGRLVAPDEGIGEDTDKDMIGRDVGIDGAAASAEEAAIHVIPDDEIQ